MSDPEGAAGGRSTREALRLAGRARPVQPGYSLGVSGRIGTLGMVVSRRSGGPPLLLSSSHALNRRPDGRSYAVYQPGGRERVRGEAPLARTLCYVRLSPRRPNLTEGALAEPLDPGEVSATHPVLGPVRGVCGRLRIGQTLIKAGRSTGVVRGRVVSLDWRGTVRFRGYSAPFARQVLVEGDGPVSLEGDSGSVWFTEDGDAAALNFASLDGGSLSVSTPIRAVLDRLAVEPYPSRETGS